MPPDYELESFWDSRFKTETHFEWLGDGQETVIPALRPFLQTRLSTGLPRLLHIGAGSSSLSDHLRDLYYGISGAEVAGGVILNTDFAQHAVDRGREAEKKTGNDAVRWERVDLLRWQDVVTLKDRITAGNADQDGPFDIVVDKSTSDAISCGEDILYKRELTSVPTSVHPLIATHLQVHGDGAISLEPLEVLALHLATLVRPGGVWIALSYSGSRFPFLQFSGERTMGTKLDTRIYWEKEKEVVVNAPHGWGKEGEGKVNVHAPDIQHHLYIFRRTDVPF
ncbi:hypothetical protein PHLCEN_2v2743 [Hermanssonia centrifuga]|uniref:Uncharacterized protein n=1 Tax=Hermanssonia centrifuga TaxID=98765 RepID=A0A2R6RHU6_9APHY|nr:hypothetical protein PHLCEN_2v2743 [Hermanssonia centrifuga]